MEITVDELLADPFINRTRFQKETIVIGGKPRPILDNLVSRIQSKDSGSEKGDANKFVIVFDVASYKHVEWLTGCDVRQSLFCWPCLLFRTQKDKWNTTGIKDLNDLRSVINAHEKTLCHIQALLDLQVFASKISAPAAAVKHDPEVLKKNREVVEMIVDSVCHLIAQERYTPNKNSLKVEDCIKTLQFIRYYDILKTSLIDDTIEKLQKAPKFLTDVIETIAGIMKMSIFKEVSNSSYVSVILTEHSTDPARSQMSTILRYLKCGEVCERFVAFTYTDAINSHHFIDHITEIVNGFQIAEKVVAISFDGSSSYLQDALKIGVQNLCSGLPYAYFIPCHFHNLESVLQKSLCSIKECDLFFKNLTVLKSYFQDKSDFWEQFLATLTGDVPNVKSFHSNYLAEFLNAVRNYRLAIINFLDFITTCVHEKLTRSDLVKINGLRAFLTDFGAVFLTEVFTKMFDQVGPLTEALHSNVPGLAFDVNVIDFVLESFCEETQRDSFRTLWSEANHLYDNLKKIYGDAEVDTPDEKLYVWLKIFLDVVKCMKDQIKYRFDMVSKFSFFRMFDLAKVENSLDPNYVLRLNKMYGQDFKQSELNKQLKVIAANKPGESLHELCKFFFKCGHKNDLSKVYDLLLTLPCTPPAVDGGNSKLHVVNSRACTSGKLRTECDASLMYVEQEYLEGLRENVSFNDQVMEEFLKRNRAYQLY